MVEKRYNYNGRWPTIFLAGGFFVICTVALAHIAATNDREVIIEGFIRLGREKATMFLWCLTAFSALFVLVALSAIVRRIVNPQTLAIDATGLWIPYGAFLTKLARVEFSEVLSLSEMKMRSQIFLKLKTHHKTYSIAESLLPSRRDYYDIKSTIASSIRRVAVGS